MGGEERGPDESRIARREDLWKREDEWALAIGQFMVAFASCEWWTYRYIAVFGSGLLHEAVADMNLSPRLKVARAVVADLWLKPELQAQVDAAFTKISTLSKDRNLVAHNGPMFHLYRDPETGEMDIRHELRSAKNLDKEVSLPRLRQLREEAQALSVELYKLFGEIGKPGNRLIPPKSQ